MYYTVDIREPFLTQVKYDVIFHMAALPRIKPSFENPKEVMEVNVNGTLNILEYARKNDIPVIYAGSSSVHGGTYKNPYTFSKWQGEELCNMYRKIYKLKVSICRFYNVYGDYMPTSGEYRTVIPIFLEQYKNNDVFTITGDGHQRRDFTHVGDIVDAIIKVMELNEYGNTFELGRGENYSIKEVVKMFPDPRWTFIEKIRGEVKDTLCESELAKEKLGWKPKINLDEWLVEQL
jgi:UDP-glucose 4-epimerase